METKRDFSHLLGATIKGFDEESGDLLVAAVNPDIGMSVVFMNDPDVNAFCLNNKQVLKFRKEWIETHQGEEPAPEEKILINAWNAYGEFIERAIELGARECNKMVVDMDMQTGESTIIPYVLSHIDRMLGLNGEQTCAFR